MLKMGEKFHRKWYFLYRSDEQYETHDREVPSRRGNKGAKAQRLLHQQTLQLQLSTLLPSFSCYPVQVCHFREEILGQKGVTSINKARNSSFLCGQLHYPAIRTLKAQSHMF